MDRLDRVSRGPLWVPLSVIALVAVAAGLRAVHLDWACLTRDESFSWRLIQYDWRELAERTAADVHPPFYYLLLEAWAGAWGSSIGSLRGLSMLLGVASVALMYLTVREAFLLSAKAGGAAATATPSQESVGNLPSAAVARSGDRPQRGLGIGAEQAAGLLAAGLITFHADQITASRTARMYSLGVFLALASSWLLLRALRCNERRLGWWPAYGATAALFCLTHYFAAFAVLAQGLFVIVEVARSRRRSQQREAAEKRGRTPYTTWKGSDPFFQQPRGLSRSIGRFLAKKTPDPLAFGAPGPTGKRRARSLVVGPLVAAVLCLVLYAPWIPAMVSQVRSVQEGFWIPPLSGQAVDEVIFGWTTGIQGPPAVLETWLVRVLVSAVLIAALRRFDSAGLLFAFQAAVPWLLCVGLSAFGQSILQERYLIFSQIGLFGMLAVVLGRGGWLPLRAAVLWLACSMTLYGTFERVSEFPVERPPVVRALKFVAQQAQAGDTVMASSHRTVNRLRYYASEAGLEHLPIRCIMSPRITRGHIVHVASLADGDIIWGRSGDRVDLQRAWFVFAYDEEIPAVPAGMQKAQERRFPGRNGSTWAAVLYVREKG